MADINRVTIIGHLTRDMELTFAGGGTAIGNISLAINRSVKKDQGWEDEANYFDVKVFGKQAQSLQPYLIKGKQIGVDGFLKQERWQDKTTGQNRSAVKIIANDVQLLGGRDGGNQSGGYQGNNYGAGYDPDGYGYN